MCNLEQSHAASLFGRLYRVAARTFRNKCALTRRKLPQLVALSMTSTIEAPKKTGPSNAALAKNRPGFTGGCGLPREALSQDGGIHHATWIG